MPLLSRAYFYNNDHIFHYKPHPYLSNTYRRHPYLSSVTPSSLPNTDPPDLSPKRHPPNPHRSTSPTKSNVTTSRTSIKSTCWQTFQRGSVLAECRYYIQNLGSWIRKQTGSIGTHSRPMPGCLGNRLHDPWESMDGTCCV